MPLLPGDLIQRKYRITRRIGEGYFGIIYAAVDKQGRKYAVKYAKCQDAHLLQEKLVYDDIAFDKYGKRAIGVPEIFYFRQRKGHDVLVMERLGPSIYEMVRSIGGLLSLKTCLMLGIEVLSRLEHLHDCGYLHCDVKPDNILTGPEENTRQIYLVDYGLAKRYRDPVTGTHYSNEVRNAYSGTPRYVSANVMRGIKPSRRDDLESLAYILVELRRGSLPWGLEHPAGVDNEGFLRTMMEMKRQLHLERFSDGFPGMLEYISYVRDLRFDEEPMYPYLKTCFIEALEFFGAQNDGNFEWL